MSIAEESIDEGDVESPADIATDWWDALPDVVEGPRRTVAEPLSVRRRRFLQGTSALLGAAAFGLFEALSGIGLSGASATVGSEYTHCTIYTNTSQYSGDDNYVNDTAPCTGGSASSYWCGSDGWFRNYGLPHPPYYYPITACNNRNAWRWVHLGNTYRCADGIYGFKLWGSTVTAFKICQKKL